MQTFLPYSDFRKSAKVLDGKRLNKQITEALQIHVSNMMFKMGIKYGWQNHPAVRMWRNHEGALLLYRNTCIDEWRSRGYNSHIYIFPNKYYDLSLPRWIGNHEFHLSHQSNMLRKNYEWYVKHFGNIRTDLPYVWPVQE